MTPEQYQTWRKTQYSKIKPTKEKKQILHLVSKKEERKLKREFLARKKTRVFRVNPAHKAGKVISYFA